MKEQGKGEGLRQCRQAEEELTILISTFTQARLSQNVHK